MLHITRSLWRAGLCILLEEPAFNRYRGFKAFFHLPIFTNTNIPPFHICPFFPLANAPLQHILFAIFFTLGLIPQLLLLLPLLLLGSAKQWLEVMWQAVMFMLRSLLLFLHFLLTSLWLLIPSLSVSKFLEKRREQVKKHLAHFLERRIVNLALTLISRSTDLSNSGCYRTMDSLDQPAFMQSDRATYKDFTFHWKKKHAKTTVNKEPELILNFMIVSPLSSQKTRRNTKFNNALLLKPTQIIHKAAKLIHSVTTNHKPLTTSIIYSGKSVKSVSYSSHKNNELMPKQKPLLIVSPQSSQRTRRNTKFNKYLLLKPLQTIHKTTKPSGTGTLNFKLQTLNILSNVSTKNNEPMPKQERTTGALSNSLPKQKPLYITRIYRAFFFKFLHFLYYLIKCQMPSFSGEKEVLNNSRTSHCKGEVYKEMKTLIKGIAGIPVGLILLVIGIVPITVVHRIVVVAKLPSSVDQLLTRAYAIVQAMTNNAWFPTPSPALSAVTTAANNLKAEQLNVKNRVPGSVPIRNTKKNALKDLLYTLRDYIQIICIANPESATGIAESALMYARKVAIRQKKVFNVLNYMTGSVELNAAIKGRNNTHDWQLSRTPSDEASWWVTIIPSTKKSRTIVDGLNRGELVYFRHRVLTKDGYSNWDEPLSIIIT